jgi:hypothetical protein
MTPHEYANVLIVASVPAYFFLINWMGYRTAREYGIPTEVVKPWLHAAGLTAIYGAALFVANAAIALHVAHKACG